VNPVDWTEAESAPDYKPSSIPINGDIIVYVEGVGVSVEKMDSSLGLVLVLDNEIVLDNNEIYKFTQEAPPLYSPASVLPSVEVKVKAVDRDDLTRTWADATDRALSNLIYAGGSCGDMVSWKAVGLDAWPDATYTWTATGPNNHTINGPVGQGKSEWKIAEGGESGKGWLDWKPGKYKVKCTINLPSISGVAIPPVEYDQEVGWRTEDYLVIGQIVETHTHDVDAPPVFSVENRPWEISSPVAWFRRALAYDIAAWFPSLSIREAVCIAPAPITGFLIEAWFFNWGILNGHDVTPRGPFTSSYPSKFGNVEYRHRYWMLQHMLNLAPDKPTVGEQITASDLPTAQDAGQYRIMHRYQTKIMADEAGKITTTNPVGTHISAHGLTKVGVGIEANQLYPGSPKVGPFTLPTFDSDTNEFNGNEPLSSDRTKTSGFSTARVGDKGCNVNWRLFGKDAPWIFSEIIFELKSDRSVQATHRASVDITWKDGSVIRGRNNFNNLNIYKAAFDPQDKVLIYERKGLLEMEGQLESFVNSASGQWREPNISPSIK
jgi:hypothetical protein